MPPSNMTAAGTITTIVVKKRGKSKRSVQAVAMAPACVALPIKNETNTAQTEKKAPMPFKPKTCFKTYMGPP